MNRERRSWLEEDPSFLRWRMISMARRFTMPIASRSSLSDPQLRSRLAFHTMGVVVVARLADSLEALSKAAANSDKGSDSSRQRGSSPNEILHMLSKANLRNTSCRSRILSPAQAKSRRGRRRPRISSATMQEANKRTAALPSSALAILRWKRQRSPSTLKIPRPRRSRRMTEKGFPLG